MTAEIHNIKEAIKRRNEAGDTIHYVAPEAARNASCPHCRICSLCGEKCCNAPRDGSEWPHVWTGDMGTWAMHTKPCTSVPIIGEKR